MALHRSPNLISESREQVFLYFKRESLAGGWQEESHNLPMFCDNDWLILLEEAGGTVPKLPNGCCLHVITKVGTV